MVNAQSLVHSLDHSTQSTKREWLTMIPQGCFSVFKNPKLFWTAQTGIAIKSIMTVLMTVLPIPVSLYPDKPGLILLKLLVHNTESGNIC